MITATGHIELVSAVCDIDFPNQRTKDACRLLLERETDGLAKIEIIPFGAHAKYPNVQLTFELSTIEFDDNAHFYLLGYLHYSEEVDYSTMSVVDREDMLEERMEDICYDVDFLTTVNALFKQNKLFVPVGSGTCEVEDIAEMMAIMRGQQHNHRHTGAFGPLEWCSLRIEGVDFDYGAR